MKTAHAITRNCFLIVFVAFVLAALYLSGLLPVIIQFLRSL